MNNIKNWWNKVKNRKFFSSWLPAPKGVVSMEALYKQIQGMMIEAGMDKINLSIKLTIAGYVHYKDNEKGGIYNPIKEITVFIGSSLVVHHIQSPTTVIELIKSYLIQRQSNTEIIDDVTVTLEDIPL